MGYIRVRQKSTGKVGRMPEENFDPNKYEQIQEEKEMTGLGKFWKAIGGPIETAGRTAVAGVGGIGALGGALAGKGYEALTGKETNLDEKSMGLANWLNQNVLEERTRKAAAPDATIGQTLTEGARQGAGIASYLMPAGAGGVAGLAGGARAVGLGAVTGGLRAGYEEDAGAGQIATGMALGGAIGGLFWSGGKLVQKGKEILKGTSDKAAQDFIKATPKDYKKAAQAGIDIKGNFNKYNIHGKFDDLVDDVSVPAGKGNKGLLQQGIDEAEKRLQEGMKKNGNQMVDMKPIYEKLTDEAAKMSKLKGNEDTVVSIMGFVQDSMDDYGTAIPADRALDLLRVANKKFGESIVNTQKGAATIQSQKIFSQTLRKQLKDQFKNIGKELDTEHELIIMQELIKNAQYKGAAGGLGLGKLDITRPLTAIEPITKSQQVSSWMASNLGRKPQQQGSSKLAEFLRRAGPMAGGIAGGSIGK